MAALDWITVEGFKSIKRIERLSLEPIDIVIGSNGSGKSNRIGLGTIRGECPHFGSWLNRLEQLPGSVE